ncbi:hypothetical protein ACFYYR_26645 [Streptomyces sp. NPDC001922]
MSEAADRARRAVRFVMATFRRVTRAMGRRPAGLVWITRRPSTTAASA